MSFTQNLTKHSFIYSISGLLFKASNLILLPVYTRVLSADEIGTIALLATFFGLFKTITYLGSQTGISREYLHENFVEIYNYRIRLPLNEICYQQFSKNKLQLECCLKAEYVWIEGFSFFDEIPKKCLKFINYNN